MRLGVAGQGQSKCKHCSRSRGTRGEECGPEHDGGRAKGKRSSARAGQGRAALKLIPQAVLACPSAQQLAV